MLPHTDTNILVPFIGIGISGIGRTLIGLGRGRVAGGIENKANSTWSG